MVRTLLAGCLSPPALAIAFRFRLDSLCDVWNAGQLRQTHSPFSKVATTHRANVQPSTTNTLYLGLSVYIWTNPGLIHWRMIFVSSSRIRGYREGQRKKKKEHSVIMIRKAIVTVITMSFKLKEIIIITTSRYNHSQDAKCENSTHIV